MKPENIYHPPGVPKTHPPGMLYSWVIPLILIAYAISCIPGVLYDVAIKQRRPFDILFPSKWSDDLFGKVWSSMTSEGALMNLDEKRAVAEGCKGVVIDVGPGLGPILQYLDKSKVTHIYGVEPNVSFHDGLKKNIEKFGWEGKYTIVPCGIEETKGLKKYGVPEEGVDTVFCIQVLCSVPNPKEILRGIYRILKPGGELRFFEHVQSQEPTTKRIQGLYDYVWHFLFGSCNMSRPTHLWLQDPEFMGFKDNEGWEIVEVEKLKCESKYDCLPIAYGRLVKKG
ncbi:hypothetical protein RUND412_009883 [Rhizina undulata]